MARSMKKKDEGPVYEVSEWLLIIGGLAWGLYGLFGNFNLVAEIFGADTIVTDVVFTIVGLAALWLGIYKLSK